MPLYDVRCSVDCGVSEIFAGVNQKDVKCPQCGQSAARIVSPVQTIGALFSKPLQFGQIGKTFETNAEYREYKKQNPNALFVDKNSREWRDHYDTVRNRADKTSKKQGFNDREDRQKWLEERKQERASRTN